jgi:hypothetical protein
MNTEKIYNNKLFKYKQKYDNLIYNIKGGGVINDFDTFCNENPNIVNNRNYLKGCEQNIVDLCQNRANIDPDESYREDMICRTINQTRARGGY